MAYRALYRQYRPTRFSEVIGQEHIVTTLTHEVESGHIAHAYLFCGTRGTGKTTSARILARAINCLSPDHGEPCGKCTACLAAQSETCGDIVEIDAASNNGVDDVRALIERVQYAPLMLRRRVYIIDEAHMITGPAFNALLKTLEEPPEHVVFILATTEPQKLPATILSRCQRFDFHRLAVSDIVSTLKSVLQKAGASIEPEGLLLIARSADGGMRDALSLADQCLAFCGNAVTAKDVYDVLGSMEEGFLFDMADALLGGDVSAALHLLDGVVRGGRDLAVFCADLSAHLRALLLAKTCGKCTDLLDCSADAMERYLVQAERAGQTQLLCALELLLHAQSDMRYLAAPRAMLESTLVRICRPAEERSLTALETRVEMLEQLASAKPPLQKSAPARTTLPAEAPVAPLAPPSAEMDSAGHDAPPWDDLVPPPEEADAPVFTPSSPPSRREPPARKAQEPVSVAQPTPKPAAVQPVSAPSDADGLWEAVLQAIRAQNIMVHMMAKNGVAQQIADGTLIVGFTDADEVQFNSVSAAVNFNRLQGILQQLQPGMQLRFMKVKLTPASDEAAARAKALFGDKLIIE